jgi:hypothetical protein
VKPDTVVLAALKKADEGDDIIVRLNETLGRRTRATLAVTGSRVPAELDFRPFEIKTLRIGRRRRTARRRRGATGLSLCSISEARGITITPCNLLEE